MSLVYLSTIMAHKNALPEEEWSNFEFYPDLTVYKLSPYTLHRLSKGGILRSFPFNSTIS